MHWPFKVTLSTKGVGPRGWSHGAMGPWGHEPWRKGPLKSAQSQLKREAWGQGARAMGPWGHGAMSHGRGERAGRAEGAGMRCSPFMAMGP